MELITRSVLHSKIVYRCNCCGAICREIRCNEYGDPIETIYDETDLHGNNCQLKTEEDERYED